MKYLFLLFELLFAITVSFAQVQDTTFLQEVTIYGFKASPYATGSRIEKIKTGNEVQTLSQSLNGNPSLYLKNYGNGQLSTIALRGTTSSQTAILWNGININSPTLGQSDFSLIPTFLFDEVSIQYGTSSSLYGSDAIGGAILLGHETPQFTKDLRIKLNLQAGSFGAISSGVKAVYGNTRWHFRSGAFRSNLKNDFPFFSPAVGYRKTQIHAGVNSYGGDQQIFYSLGNGQILSAEAMYIFNFREIQPAVTNEIANETLKDRHFRNSITYQRELNAGLLSATSAFVSTVQEYFNDFTSTVRSTQFSTLLTIENTLNLKSNLRYGFNYNHYNAQSENYKDAKENRFDVFVSYRYAILNSWIISLNARQSLYDQKYAPFSPTVGTEVDLITNKKHKLTVRMQAGRGFRVPTLNDRFWVPGGNPFLKPEDALQIETGFEWQYQTQKSKLQFSSTYHQSWIDQMIVWMLSGAFSKPRPVQPGNDGLWSPSNLQKVNIQGMENSFVVDTKVGNVSVKGRAAYHYTQSLNKEGLNAFDKTTVNKQMPYVPPHAAKTSVSMNYKVWEIEAEYIFTGVRYTTLDNTSYQSLNAYNLFNVSVTGKLTIASCPLQLKCSANNILNVYYESLRHHAMPGRNFLISLIFTNKI